MQKHVFLAINHENQLVCVICAGEQESKQEAKGMWRRLHRMTPRTWQAAYTACAAADLSRVTDRQTDRHREHR